MPCSLLDHQVRVIPLKRLALKLFFASPQEHTSENNFNSKNFTELIRLLASTQVEQLEFSSVNYIPRLLEAHRVESLKLLRLSGSCRFMKDVCVWLFYFIHFE